MNLLFPFDVAMSTFKSFDFFFFIAFKTKMSFPISSQRLHNEKILIMVIYLLLLAVHAFTHINLNVIRIIPDIIGLLLMKWFTENH